MRQLKPDERADRRDRIVFDYDDAAVETAWERFPEVKPHSPLKWIAPTAIVSAAAAALLVFWWLRPHVPQWDEPLLTAGSQPVEVEMRDGSRISLSADSQLEQLEASDDDTRLRLEGRASFEVSHNPNRAFIVLADGVEVRVVGTKFSVTNSGPEVRVDVERGAVDVRWGEQMERLTAGERWRLALEEEVEVTEASPEEPEAEEQVAQRRRRRPARASAEELFAQARSLKREGNPRQAASVFARIVDRYASDPRAPIAAVELGRLRMDRLRDRSGAIRAFRQALRLDPNLALREDVLARLVKAQNTSRLRRACERDRARYLGEYPTGVHRAEVEAACQQP